MTEAVVLSARGMTRLYGAHVGCAGIDIDLHEAEVLAVVGESGSGKSTLLGLLSTQIERTSGSVTYCNRDGAEVDLDSLTELERRFLLRTEWGFVHQDARHGLRMNVSAGGNVGERLMAIGWRNYAEIRKRACEWLERVEIAPARIDELPTAFSGGMRQRLQIARNMVTAPRLLFMDEPTGGLDVSVQARILDLLRSLVENGDLSVILVTHDLSVARLLSDRIAVMRNGRIVEIGLADQVLDDPQHAYTQLLVSSILQT